MSQIEAQVSDERVFAELLDLYRRNCEAQTAIDARLEALQGEVRTAHDENVRLDRERCDLIAALRVFGHDVHASSDMVSMWAP